MAKRTRSRSRAPTTPVSRPTHPTTPAEDHGPPPERSPRPGGYSHLLSVGAGFLGGLLAGVLVVWFGVDRSPAPQPNAIAETKKETPESPPEKEAPAQRDKPPMLGGLSPDARGLLRPNVLTDFNPDIELPTVDPTAFLDPYSSVIGNVHIGAHVYLGPFSSARGDEGQPIYIGDESNLQDGVVIHALETIDHGKPKPSNEYEVNGKRYAVYIGERVSLAHQSHIHGPAWVEDDVFVGMQAMVFRAHIGKRCVIEPGAIVIGVTIPENRYVPAGKVVTDQATADALPEITEDYPFHEIDKAVVHVNHNLAEAYSGRHAEGVPE